MSNFSVGNRVKFVSNRFSVGTIVRLAVRPYFRTDTICGSLGVVVTAPLSYNPLRMGNSATLVVVVRIRGTNLLHDIRFDQRDLDPVTKDEQVLYKLKMGSFGVYIK